MAERLRFHPLDGFMLQNTQYHQVTVIAWAG